MSLKRLVFIQLLRFFDINFTTSEDLAVALCVKPLVYPCREKTFVFIQLIRFFDINFTTSEDLAVALCVKPLVYPCKWPVSIISAGVIIL